MLFFILKYFVIVSLNLKYVWSYGILIYKYILRRNDFFFFVYELYMFEFV